MPSLKDLRNRISSVKSTKKITSAMKMVAAAKLKRAQENAERSRPYAEKMKEVVSSLIGKVNNKNFKFGNRAENSKNVLLIICTSDRGLCGGFNGSITKFTKNLIKNLDKDGKKISCLFVGKKGYQTLKKTSNGSVIDLISDFANPTIKFEIAGTIRDKLLDLFFKNEINECFLIYTKFKSAISQTVNSQILLPVSNDISSSEERSNLIYDYEPSEDEILDNIIPKNIAIQIHSALLENLASEQGSRMTAMDNATRNANDMIDNLTLFYNRSRQALITKELIEIISGAEAV